MVGAMSGMSTYLSSQRRRFGLPHSVHVYKPSLSLCAFRLVGEVILGVLDCLPPWSPNMVLILVASVRSGKGPWLKGGPKDPYGFDGADVTSIDVSCSPVACPGWAPQKASASTDPFLPAEASAKCSA